MKHAALAPVTNSSHKTPERTPLAPHTLAPGVWVLCPLSRASGASHSVHTADTQNFQTMLGREADGTEVKGKGKISAL